MARRMTLSGEVAGLSQRVDKLDQRVDRFETRVGERFEAIDKRFDAIDQRFDRFKAKVDKRFEAVDVRFDDLKRQLDVIAEASRDDFRNLYDLFQAHMQHMEARTGTLAVSLRAEMTLGYDALDSRVTVLERRAPTVKRRR